MENTTNLNKAAFDAATRVFGAAPGVDTMLLLTITARTMMQPASVIRYSKRWQAPATGVEFTGVRFTTDRSRTQKSAK